MSNFAETLYVPRSRQSWNDRFAHWERPPSDSEEAIIQRAQLNVESAISSNAWLIGGSVAIKQQGSYYNNTNVRREADIDLRAVHPAIRVQYVAGIDGAAHRRQNYSDLDWTFDQIFTRFRAELKRDLFTNFGARNVDPGRKAFRISGITGSRAEVDVVPCVRFHHVVPAGVSEVAVHEGIAILATDGGWTLNFPEQHHVNGIAKRAQTAHRFKKAVRIFKRLRADMTSRGLLTATVPSFLVECLVYLVEDAFFLVPEDDRYDRMGRVAVRMRSHLYGANAAQLREINGLKLLFGASQGWQLADARAFVDAVITHLGNY